MVSLFQASPLQDSPPPDPPVRFTALRGPALLAQPALNKDTAFSPDERHALELDGLLPAAVETIEQQVRRVWDGFQRLGDPLARFLYVSGLRQRNLTLFHHFLQQHIDAVLPVVYTPTVGAVIEARLSITHESKCFEMTSAPSGIGRLTTDRSTPAFHCCIASVLENPGPAPTSTSARTSSGCRMVCASER